MSEIILPTKAVGVESLSPESLLLYSAPKMGKTTLLSKLEDCLIIDLENGTTFVEALKIKANNYEKLEQTLISIKKAGNPYKYIALDTLTALEDMCLPKAAQIYKALPIGSKWKGTDVRTLPKGAGYLYLRLALFRIINIAKQCCKRLILVGHLRDKIIDKAGKEVMAADIALTGKIKEILCSKVDTIAYLYRNKNTVYASFKSRDEVNCGSRTAHLRGKEIVLGENNPTDLDDDITAYWNNIYID